MAGRAIRKTIADNELDLRNSMWPDAEDRGGPAQPTAASLPSLRVCQEINARFGK